MVFSLLFFYFLINKKQAISTKDTGLLETSINDTVSYNFEDMIYYRLINDYDKKMRPPNSIQVNFAFNLIQVINLVEKDQVALLNAFIDHSWFDSR